MNDWLTGELVRLAAPNPETDGELFAKWSNDGEYLRLLDSDPARGVTIKQAKEFMEEEQKDNQFRFMIHTAADDRVIGFIGLWVNWVNDGAWVGIGVGEPEFRGKGYGTDAMRVLLRFAFTELNLHRVSLGLFGYNERARRSYEKAGFTLEGHMREEVHREGKRWDGLVVGILRREWQATQEMRE
ncbi:MAG TPA: GNAT family protein [Anaerolineae bacterium]